MAFKWTAEADEALRQRYSIATRHELSHELGTYPGAVTLRAIHLGLTKARSAAMTPRQIMLTAERFVEWRGAPRG